MPQAFASFFLCLLMPGLIWAQLAEERVAFVIGNSNYTGSAPLPNPINDANAIAQFLRGNGFKTTQLNNLLSNQIPDFRQQLEKQIGRNTVVFIYYAGHGVQFEGRNYLLPVDTRVDSMQAITDDSIYLGDVLAAIEKKRPKLAVVILDACRDNPFKDRKSNRFQEGLARVDPPSSTVVFYATRPGGVAADGNEGNGLFTKELLRAAQTPELPIEVLFRRTSSAVYRASKGDQEPWVEGVIREEFVVTQNQAHNPSTGQLVSPTPVPVAAIATSSKPNSATNPDPISEAIVQESAGIDPTPLSVALATQAISPTAHAGSRSEDSLSIYPLSPASIGTSQNTSPVSWEMALRNLSRSIKGEQKDAGTMYTCINDECVPYKEWARRLKDGLVLQELKDALQKIKPTSSMNLCEFDLEKNKCAREDLKITIINPLTPISSHFIDGVKLSSAKVSSSGGLAFEGSIRQGARFFGLGKNHVSCADNSGRLEFLNDRVDINFSRCYCLALVPVPVTAKITFNVLLADPLNRQFIVQWDWGMIAVLGAGSGSGIAKLVFE